VSCSLDDVTSSISIHWYQTGIAMADSIGANTVSV